MWQSEVNNASGKRAPVLRHTFSLSSAEGKSRSRPSSSCKYSYMRRLAVGRSVSSSGVPSSTPAGDSLLDGAVDRRLPHQFFVFCCLRSIPADPTPGGRKMMANY